MSTPPPDPSTPPVAVITGASSGIGRAVAVALAATGHACTLVSLQMDKLAATARLLATSSRILPVDFGDAAMTGRLAGQIAEMPRIDVLVHCAGVLTTGPAAEMPPAEFARMHAVNFLGPCRLTQAALPALERSRGQIVFMNSSAAVRPSPGLAAYASSKAALATYANVLRDEVNPRGIRVINVFPGRTATPMQAVLFRAEGRDYHPEHLLQPEDVAAIVKGALELPRTAEVTDIHIRPMKKHPA